MKSKILDLFLRLRIRALTLLHIDVKCYECGKRQLGAAWLSRARNWRVCSWCFMANTIDDDFDDYERECCFACGGDGIVQEDEYECDWINFGPNVITCPDCAGTGYVSLDWEPVTNAECDIE